MMKEQGANYYDQVANKYPVYGAHYTEYRKWFPLLLLVADRLIYNKNHRIVDLGCGAGHLAELLFDFGFTSYVGLDFSEEMLKLARRRGLPYEFRHCDLNSGNWNDYAGDYTCVIATEFVEHVEKDLGILNLIESNTRVMLTTTNEPGIEHVRVFKDESDVHERYNHLFSTMGVTSFKNMLLPWGWQVFYIIDGITK
jgi:2-polyprenyl-3-methyl-5-hydroxy-6-metoxy-1,4-benzoquinol methylase